MRLFAILALAAMGTPSVGQSLFLRDDRPPLNTAGRPDTTASLDGLSLLFVEPPKPKVFKLHDQVTIIINETSRSQSKQKLDTKKDYRLDAALKEFPDLAALLDGVLESGASSPIVGVDVSGKNAFKGEGTYERSDRLSDRITATIIDVKPNGVLVLEARRAIRKDKEVQTVVIAGNARTDDVTDANTILSSQLADLAISVQNDGRVKDSSEKGLIPRVLDAIFAF
ncbi:MAG: flagellar basal body L-ring protein FlgH [Phycisphaerae bacterium]|nr:flagellar basal body L-ring protein FlgH [Phycisphaerae bacterium]